MLITITSERVIENETVLINSLFKEGLEVLHVRKPNLDEEECKKWISKIEKQYYHQIIIHQHHDLCADFELKGIHLKEQARRDMGNDLEEYVSRFKNKGYLVSSSFHSKEDLKNNGHHFDYVLLSPVFDSISKNGYLGKKYDVQGIEQTVIGLGGITTANVSKAHTLGYNGVAVLGGIWNTKNPNQSFINIKKEYEFIFRKSSISAL